MNTKDAAYALARARMEDLPEITKSSVLRHAIAEAFSECHQDIFDKVVAEEVKNIFRSIDIDPSICLQSAISQHFTLFIGGFLFYQELQDRLEE